MNISIPKEKVITNKWQSGDIIALELDGGKVYGMILDSGSQTIGYNTSLMSLSSGRTIIVPGTELKTHGGLSRLTEIVNESFKPESITHYSSSEWMVKLTRKEVFNEVSHTTQTPGIGHSM